MHTRNHIQIGRSFLIWGALSSPNLDIRGTNPPRLRVSDFAAGSPLDWGDRTHSYSNILVIWETCRFSVNLRLLHFNQNEDIKYRTAKCNADMNLFMNETNQTRKFSFNMSVRWNINEIFERNAWNHCSKGIKY